MNKKMNALLATEVLSVILPINKEIPSLNAGGCGVFACYFAEKMISLGYNAKIIELSESDWLHDTPSKDEFMENTKNMHMAKEKHANPSSLNIKADSHYCVEIDGFYFDSTLVRERQGDKLQVYGGFLFDIVGEVDLHDMEYISIENRGNGIWNDMYSEGNNDKIKKFIDNALSFLTIKDSIC